MNRALVPPASLPTPSRKGPASHEQSGAMACPGSTELARCHMEVSGPPRSNSLDGKTPHSSFKTPKNHSRHLLKVFRLELIPVLCFLRVMSTFNRTLVSVRNSWEPISHA